MRSVLLLYDGRLRLTIGEETAPGHSAHPRAARNLKISPMGEAPPDQDGILQHWKVSQVRGLASPRTTVSTGTGSSTIPSGVSTTSSVWCENLPI